MIRNILSKIWMFIAAILGFLGLWFAAKQSGKKEQLKDSLIDSYKGRETIRKKSNEIDNKIDGLDDVELRKSADKWVR